MLKIKTSNAVSAWFLRIIARARLLHCLSAVTFAGLLTAGCSSQSPEAVTATLQPKEPAVNAAPGQPTLDAPENIAVRILKMDAQVKPVTDQMFQTLKEVMDDACGAIGKLRRKPNGWDRPYAEAVLRCIDAALINHGFVYPDAGGVDQLADALTPFQMSDARRPAFEAQKHNQRRARLIAERFPGPFYSVDCDTAGFIYLGVAEQLNLPLHLVTIPSVSPHSGHAFVRWREGSHFLDWETMDGSARTDEFYIKEWNIDPAAINAQSALTDLTVGQAIGCEHYLLAIQWERRGNHEPALRELSTALELHPQDLDARREFAWVTATGTDVRLRNNAKGITDALLVVKLVDDPDAHDTLAAAYASAGMFDLAVKEERTAISKSPASIGSRPAYRQRLELYQHQTVYRQSAPNHAPAAASQP